MKKTLFLTLILIVLIVVACSITNGDPSKKPVGMGQNDYLVVAPPGSTATPTPFQPIADLTPGQNGGNGNPRNPSDAAPTRTPDPLVTATPANPWGDYAGPSVWPDVDVPTPVGVLPHPDGQVNIMLLGSDQRPNDGGFRTDTIQLLTINPHEGSVKLTSFPRDLYVYIPGYTVQRINVAMQWGGFDALANTMEYNFGVRPAYFILINFWSFRDVVDSLGGINVYVAMDLCDQRDSYENYCIYQGTNWMDGTTALWYVRSRMATGDIDRGRRQQEVLEAIFEQLLNLDGVTRAPELYEIYKQNVTTNLDFDILSSLLPIASHLAETQQVGRFSIGDEQVYDWTNTNGAMVLVPIYDSVMEVMRQAISVP